mmetsp:Transcript_48505/g.152101  ORF Transcript_48505/g.152101 Transcript_48505/m.152101 type:complete len:312 (-) Transcript_48505:2274-3209(-)
MEVPVLSEESHLLANVLLYLLALTCRLPVVCYCRQQVLHLLTRRCRLPSRPLPQEDNLARSLHRLPPLVQIFSLNLLPALELTPEDKLILVQVNIERGHAGELHLRLLSPHTLLPPSRPHDGADAAEPCLGVFLLDHQQVAHPGVQQILLRYRFVHQLETRPVPPHRKQPDYIEHSPRPIVILVLPALPRHADLVLLPKLVHLLHRARGEVKLNRVRHFLLLRPSPPRQLHKLPLHAQLVHSQQRRIVADDLDQLAADVDPSTVGAVSRPPLLVLTDGSKLRVSGMQPLVFLLDLNTVAVMYQTSIGRGLR